ncbi:MAG: hypothetical protein PHU46_11990 [Rhodocyclaceae bacterium]|nr:hypothetical protein [Rhodocyclaceae bacterium]
MTTLPSVADLRRQSGEVDSYAADVRRGAHMADDPKAHRCEMAQAACLTAAAGHLNLAAAQLEQAAAHAVGR